ncbi:MAG TPA: DUF1156 domain-containing protein [bacterium]|nr:DUF1156 domain-containing protein [bacterium]HQL63630.1 DUF1156 domain-containing protein [bacterium]
MTEYPKRLIEVDLPIKRISAHARREKSIRHGHISTLHIWWARRPLAACRAVICAALWPDPADEHCPPTFREKAARIITEFAHSAMENESVAGLCSEISWGRWVAIAKKELSLSPDIPEHLNILRHTLLDFIADFSAWEASTEPHFLETARRLTQAAHEALGGDPGTRPLVVDPFAGGGSIPLEALRVGADAFASDLNPVAVLLNKVVLEYIPKYGQRLADEVRKWGEWIRKEAEKELGRFYPKDPDGATPIAYLWARTIQCEGPGCGAEVPLMRSLWLAKKGSRSVALRMVPDAKEKRVDFEVIEKAKAKDVGEGTVQRGAATCPVCGYTTPVTSVRAQLKPRHGGAADARLFVVVTTRPGQKGRFYRLPNEDDLQAVRAAERKLREREKKHTGPLSLVPDELTPRGGGSGAGRAFSQRNYGMEQFADLFTPRQALALTTLVRLVQKVGQKINGGDDKDFGVAVQTCLALAVDRQADYTSSLARWHTTGEKISATFGRQALPMVWDYTEVNALSDSSGGFKGAWEWVIRVCKANRDLRNTGHTELASALKHPLPDDSANFFITDPPYYDAVPYADLSDFFLVWLKRSLGNCCTEISSFDLAPKDEECIVDEVKNKTKEYYEKSMTQAMINGRRVLTPKGIGVVVFANKTTTGWEALLNAMVDAGWIITGSWPIDTEMGSRLRAMNSAALASSIHLVCRPRENPDGSVRADDVGDWRDVLQELPKRIHDWMPRLAREGIVGADAIFACIGPALEVFSRYSRVEKASGEQVTLKEYLEHIWAAVSKEALNMIFEGAEATGFEEDARLTTIWLWTLSTGANGNGKGKPEPETEDEEEEGPTTKKTKMSGFVLEFDAARMIAQGLGAHLERLTSVVEVKGDKARLLPVSERAKFLFAVKRSSAAAKQDKQRKESPQEFLFEIGRPAEAVTDDPAEEPALLGMGTAKTVLDRVHQSMLLFASGRGAALKRFLVEDGAGRDPRFWRLAQALSALYPMGTDEKRWVDGVFARKKGLGL